MQTQEKPADGARTTSLIALRKNRARSVRQVVLSSLQTVTPARLGLLLMANFALIAMFCFAAVTTIQRHEHAVRTVGVDAAPSVIAAFEIKSGVAAMDADLVNQLLHGPDDKEARDMQLDFDKWRRRVCQQLVVAAKNITYGNAEQTPIENIQIALGTYEMQAQAARDVHEEGDKGDDVRAYAGAYSTLQSELLANADKLEKADGDVLEATYDQEKAATNLSRGFVLVMGMVVIAMLSYTQLYLMARFHRRLCPPILISIVGIAFCVWHLNSSLAGNSLALKVAKEDAYDSVLALLNARSSAFKADAAASRFLFDRENAAAHQKTFAENVAQVASFDKQHNFKETIERASKELKQGDRVNLPGFDGALAKELSNVRFPGEGNAALEALQQFASYSAVQDQVKQRVGAGDFADAIHLCLSYDPQGAKFPLTKFDDALLNTLHINQEAMEKKVNEAFSYLDGLVMVTEVASLLAVMCVYLGILPRMEEYFHCEPRSVHENNRAE